MTFIEKYCLSSDSALPENKTKIIVSNDAFAVGEVIQELIYKIEQARCSLI